MSEPTTDDTNEPRLMTRIDGEEARLLVHIEPIDAAAGGATEANEPEERQPSISGGLAESHPSVHS